MTDTRMRGMPSGTICDHVRQYFACKVNRRDIDNPSAYGRSEFVNYSSLLSGQIMNGGAF